MVKRYVLVFIFIFIFFSKNTLFSLSGTSYDLREDKVSFEHKIWHPKIAVFGDTLVGMRTDTVVAQFQYNIPTDLFRSVVSNGGSVLHDPDTGNMALVQSGTSSNGQAYLESKQFVRYTPGRESYAYFTALFTEGASDATQWIGILDDLNGFAVGCSDGKFAVLHRRNGTDSIIEYQKFNLDILNGRGRSGMSIDVSKMNVFRISFGWLGTAPATFEVCRKDGVWIPFHKFQFPNSISHPSIVVPTLPVRMEVKKTAGSNNIKMKSASWAAGTMGKTIFKQSYKFVEDSKFSKTSPKVILALRNKSVLHGKNNRALVKMKRFLATVRSEPIWKDFQVAKFKILKGDFGSVIGGSWQDHNSSNSAIEYNVTATGNTANDGILIPLSDRRFINMDFGLDDTEFLILPGEEVAIVASTNTSSVVTADVNIVWEETVT